MDEKWDKNNNMNLNYRAIKRIENYSKYMIDMILIEVLFATILYL